MGAQNVSATFAGNHKFGLLSWQSHTRQNYTTGEMEALNDHASADVTGPCNNVLCYEPRYSQLKILIKQPAPVCSLQHFFLFFFLGSLAVLGTPTALCFFYLWTWSQDCNQASENVVLVDGLTNKSCLHAKFIFFFVPCTISTLEFVIFSGNLCMYVCTCRALVCALMSSP